jgi:hypothetical protein
MIYATCLNEQTSIFNEDFVTNLLMENVQMQTTILVEESSIITENAISDFVGKVINFIKETISKFRNWIVSKISSIKKTIKPRSNTSSNTSSDKTVELWDVKDNIYEIETIIEDSTEKISNKILKNYSNISSEELDILAKDIQKAYCGTENPTYELFIVKKSIKYDNTLINKTITELDKKFDYMKDVSKKVNMSGNTIIGDLNTYLKKIDGINRNNPNVHMNTDYIDSSTNRHNAQEMKKI